MCPMRLPDLEVETHAARELVEITAEVRRAVAAAGLREGLLLVYCPHTTAGITIQENADPDVRRDLLLALENAIPDAPARGRYRHAEGNSPAHAMASLLGSSATVIVRDGAPLLGTWQGVFLCELDGPRRRTVHLQAVAP
ncbi:protein of unknown function UPF0047 [Anaeromyxobacter dehalogenans 2CP-1]|uniref:Secondary thiamine-phosphate synthase enzyme n=2 Tax=Anaeromyxobacter dehalogenans TaxID=161493 RepID=B8JEK8_ANAD2|nr:protein of unknown function UPF0047 [Anaeromyxobacter dehalogenans 2CP-1]